MVNTNLSKDTKAGGFISCRAVFTAPIQLLAISIFYLLAIIVRCSACKRSVLELSVK